MCWRTLTWSNFSLVAFKIFLWPKVATSGRHVKSAPTKQGPSIPAIIFGFYSMKGCPRSPGCDASLSLVISHLFANVPSNNVLAPISDPEGRDMLCEGSVFSKKHSANVLATFGLSSTTCTIHCPWYPTQYNLLLDY